MIGKEQQITSLMFGNGSIEVEQKQPVKCTEFNYVLKWNIGQRLQHAVWFDENGRHL